MVGGYGNFAEVYEYRSGALLDRSFPCYSCWQFGVSALDEDTVAGAGCFAHSGFTASRVWMYDGVQFSAASLTEPNPYGMATATDVCLIDEDNAVAVGRDHFTNDGVIWHGGADGFLPQDPPFIIGDWSLSSVALCPDGRVVAAGAHESRSRGLLLVRDQKAWTIKVLPFVSADWSLLGVSCSDTDIFAVGWDRANGRGLVLVGGDSWQTEPPPLPSGDWGLNAIAVDAHGGGYAVGFDSQHTKAVILRRSEATWSQENPPPSLGDIPLLGVDVFPSVR